MKKKIFWTVFIFLMVINISAFGTLIYHKLFPDNPRNNTEEHYLTGLKDSLKLSENQFCEMKECQGCFKHDMMNISNEIKKHRISLVRNLKENNPDSQKINNSLLVIDSLQSSLLREVVNNLLTCKKIMNNEQRERFFSILLNEFSLTNEANSLNNKTNNQ